MYEHCHERFSESHKTKPSECIYDGFRHCIRNRNKDDPKILESLAAMLDCFAHHKVKDILADCLSSWYETHFKRPVISTPPCKLQF